MVKNLKFIFALICFCALSAGAATKLDIGPFVQLPGKNSMTIKWNTDDFVSSIIEYTSDDINFYTIEEVFPKQEHLAFLTDLQADTKYTYSIFAREMNEEGATNYRPLKNAANEDRFSFETEPVVDDQVLVWVLGDPGVRGDSSMSKNIHKSQLKVQRKFFKYLKKVSLTNNLDFMLTLGDNAYSFGTYEEYKKGFFEPYAKALAAYPVFSVFGNHDGGLDRETLNYSARSYPGPEGTYYNLFSLPGEQAYYSFDRGDAHFVVLDSFDSLWEDFKGDNFEEVWTSDSKIQNKMLKWLEDDLKYNDQTWTIVAFHHPPFGQTEHDNEKKQDIWKAWTNAYITPILHEYNVDLVLMGHIHNYQRSYPLALVRKDLDRSKLLPKAKIKEEKKAFVEKYMAILDELKLPRYIPKATSYETVNYTKADDPIYVIMGSSGAAFRDLPDEKDPDFYTAMQEAGSALLNIKKDTLRFRFVGADSDVFDSFTITK